MINFSTLSTIEFNNLYSAFEQEKIRRIKELGTNINDLINQYLRYGGTIEVLNPKGREKLPISAVEVVDSAITFIINNP